LILFFPPHFYEAAMLEECVSNHRHQRMTMKAGPRSSLEVIETAFILQLLVSLLADPSCLDRRSQAAQVHPSGQVGKIVFLLPGCSGQESFIRLPPSRTAIR